MDDDDVTVKPQNTKFGQKWVRGSRKTTTEIEYRVLRNFPLPATGILPRTSVAAAIDSP